MQWDWTEKGAKFGEQEHALAVLPEAEAADAARHCSDSAEIEAILRSAKHSFQTGQANYSDAARNLEDLVVEYAKAKDVWHSQIVTLAERFTPPVKEHLMKMNEVEVLSFVTEALQKLLELSGKSK